ncbi:cytochrome c oxidase assembly protein COX18, mitochondrial [Pseudophryne corroboree]|uniref:cytochrome c oxidase assembly protein COX18, mitochondrial n=1 Tax=Pseudophryne corroboree TaxID=495146 RepID=UPI0030819708
MFCQSMKNPTVWTKSNEFLSYQIMFSSRCQYARFVGTVSFKSQQQGLRKRVQVLPDVHRSCGVYGQSLFLAAHLPPPNRTVTSAASLAAAYTGQPYGDHGVYAKLADSAPVHLAENVLISVQEATGLPWWANIVCSTILLRTAVTLPLSVYQMYILDKVENLQAEIHSLAKRLRYEVSVYGKQHGWTDKVAKFHFRKNMKRIVNELYVRDNIHPFKASLIMWIQIPMWIFISLALRNFSFNTNGSSAGTAIYRQLQEGGALWFSDLAMPDYTWILPVYLGLINLLLVELFALRKTQMSRFQKYMTNIIRGVSVVMIPIAASVPSCMALYWASSSTVGLVHNLLLRSPTVRRIFRLPRTKLDSDTPYKDLLSAFVAKYIQKK